MTFPNRQHGLALIELALGLAIISGVLFAIIGWATMSRGNTRALVTAQEIRSIERAVDKHYAPLVASSGTPYAGVSNAVIAPETDLSVQRDGAGNFVSAYGGLIGVYPQAYGSFGAGAAYLISLSNVPETDCADLIMRVQQDFQGIVVYRPSLTYVRWGNSNDPIVRSSVDAACKGNGSSSSPPIIQFARL